MTTGKFLLLPVFLISSLTGISQTGTNTPWYWRHGEYTINQLWTLSSTQLNILPVTLNNFWATLSGHSVCIYWQASNEENFSHYVLQRSRDAKSYENIAFISGKAGQPGIINFYSYEDADAMGIVDGKIYYRLQMLDRNGDSYLSNVAVISKGINGPTLLIYPNPTTGLCHLIVENAVADASAQLLILNSSGMEVEEKMLKLAKGRNVFTLNLEKHAPGLYVLRLRTSKGSIEAKLVIQ